MSTILPRGTGFAAQRMWTNAAWAQKFVLRQSAGGPAIDLTGWVIEGEAHKAEDLTNTLDLSIGNGRLIVDPAAGEITVTFSRDNLAAFGDGILHVQVMGNAPGPDRPLITFSSKIWRGIDE